MHVIQATEHQSMRAFRSTSNRMCLSVSACLGLDLKVYILQSSEASSVVTGVREWWPEQGEDAPAVGECWDGVKTWSMAHASTGKGFPATHGHILNSPR